MDLAIELYNPIKFILGTMSKKYVSIRRWLNGVIRAIHFSIWFDITVKYFKEQKTVSTYWIRFKIFAHSKIKYF